ANGDSCDVFNNIFLDPLFSTDPDSLYRLTENSPCIDAGDPASPYDPDNTIADMGAFYFWHELELGLSGPLSGTIESGEYHVVGDISVATGESLTIEAGTTLLFDDYYSFTVNGFLHVAGTETDSVIFTAAEGNDSWAGITFSCDYQIENLVEYARISQSSASAPNPDGGAILIQPASHVTINNSTITGNHADGNGGGIAVAVGTLANVHLNYCLITGNSADSEGGGLFCNLGSEIFIDQCTISYNSCGVTGAGIRDHDSWLTVTNSVISHNTGGVGVFLSFNVTNISSFLYSDFYGHTEGNFGGWIPDGVEIITSTNANGDSCDVFNNIFLDPLFSAEPDSAYRLTEDSPCIDAGDPASPLDPDGTVADMGAYYFWHEDNTLTGPLSGTLTAGEYHVVGDISVEAGDSLVIEPGVTLLFEGHFELDINGLLTAVGTEADSITFMSAEVDVPWGGIDINDSSSDDSELGYCLITGSNSSGVHCDSSNVTINNSLITGNSSINHGGGVYCNAAGPTISNNTIDGNSALYWGSGIYCDNSNPDIFNNTITGNYVTDSLGKGGGICLQFNSNPNIDGNIITGNSAIFCGGGIYCQSSIPVINGNYISGNSSDYGGGIYCYLDCSSDITDNNINGNIAGLYGGGIYLHSNSDAVIERNIICNNSVTTYYGGGIHCGLSAPIISNNTISENSSAGLGGGMYFNNSSPTIFNVIVENNNGDGGISFRDSPTSTLTYSDIFNNVNGSFSGNTIPANLGAITTTNANGDSCDVFNNIFLDPLFSTNPDSLYRLTADSPCIDAGDPASPVDPDGTIADMGAYYFWHESNLILHVPSEYATIQAAIDASSDGDTVLVEDGIYTGNGNYYIDFGGRAIVVTSENGPENCIIDCENQGRGFNFQSGEDSVSVVSGFTITNGWVGHGGAFYILDNSSPKIDNCHIIDNSASGNGGGIRIEDSDPIIRNCLISGNSSTTMSCGGISCSSSNAAIENCIIEYNSGPSAGGGGFFSGQFSTPTVRNCTIRSNTANKGGGILVYAQSDINLENCAIDSNNASGADGDGGGIYVSVGCDAHIANCTLSGNTAQYQGGGICVYMGNLYLENSIITNSIGEGGIYFDNPYPATSIAYSDFNGNENGAFTGNVPADLGAISTTNVNGDPCDVFSNIFLDPLFNTNPDSAYRLTEDSPCIDAGDPAGLLDPDGTVADMGAYYFWHDSTATGPDTLWTRTYGGSEDDRGSCVRETWDGGYITTGSTYSYGAGNSDVYLIKTDSGGVEQWNQTFGGNGHDMGCSLQPTVDGGNIVAGYSNSFNAGDDGDFYLIKTDNEGNEIWSKTYGGSDYDEGYSVQQTYEGGYVLAGYTSSFGAGERDVWVIKTDEMGDSLWSNTFGGASDDEGQCILSTLDGGYIIVGKTESYGSGNLDVYLIKTDSFGNQEWSRTFGGELEDVGLGIDLTSDGGFIITGYTYSGSMGLNDVYFIKTDSNGDTLWTRTYGGSNYDEGHSVHQMPDGGYFITGGTLSFGAGSNDVYLIRTDANGDLLWSSTCGGTSYDLGISGELLIDGGFVIAGRTNSYGAGNYDVYLIRLEGDGTVPPQITLISPNGGETWTVGDTVESTWTVTGEIDSFDVRLSRDGGASYNELLSAGIPGDSTAWTWQGVSAPASDSCSISIIGYFGQFQTSDQSDGLFSIVPPLAPTLAVTYPDGGETWDVGDTVSITWEADAGFESFEILLSRTAGEPWDTLTSSLSGLAENWVWEGVTGPESDECLIKIIGNSGAFTVEDVSDSVFTILPELPSGPEVLWTNTFGGGADEEARSHTSVSSSGGYALTGSVESGGSDDVYLIETDSDGNLLNLNNIGGILDDGGYCISETEDGGYIVAGYTFSEGSGSADYYLVKVDSGLEEEWTNTFGGSLEDRAYGVVEIPGEGYALAGFRTTLDGRDVYLVRTDVSGNYLWHQSFGGIGMDDCRSLARTADGGFILAGSTENFMADSIDAYIIKTDEFGGEEWSILIGENGTDIACSIIQLENGDYAGTGSTTSAGAGGEDVFLFKISSGGVFEWSRTYGGNLNDAGNSLKQTTDQGFVISGYTESSGAGGSDAYVIKTDAEGNAEWTKTIGGSENEIGYSMGLVSNIGYTIAGYTESYGSGGKDAWLIRLGPETPDVTVTLEPVEPPIIVPASGGEFEFTIFITNNSSVVQTTDIWTQIILPSSAAIPLINVQDIDIPPMTLERLRTQSVPEFAPGGIYSYYAYVGDYPWIVNHSNSFNFEKLGSEDGRIGTPFDWLCSGETFAGEKSVYAQIPKSYALSLPYPNPFNPTAAISYDLPKAGNVSIIVYNVSGREVASLIDRWQYPGSHLLTFDAAGLSSGIYFVRMNSGDFCRSHKMILLK
ncbi:MAG: right-handed parallel beta-helix repeat-containing protein, partial [FCB group bacterium]|nr:right-handed parallel beta-helix repeat-containing protein [FCB group bacterium]